MNTFLIVGLGNIGEKYDNTRHNIGFKILDELAKKQQISFQINKLGETAKFRYKGKKFLLLKPSTYVNLSGKAVKYWMVKEKIPTENILIITDDLNIDFGTIRVKSKGSDGGHNGLKDIQEKLNTQVYPRFRFGIGTNYSKGKQIDYVLGNWNKKEQNQLIERLNISCELILCFGTSGLQYTMNTFNRKIKTV